MKHQLKSILPILLLILGINITFSEERNEKDDRIFWTNKPVLTFEDFKANPYRDPMSNPDYSSEMNVLAKIRKTILVQKKVVNKLAKFKVYAAMIRNGSWIKIPNDTASLKHEQAHYDICEIHARLLRKELVKAKSMDQAKRMFDRISSNEIAEQNLFDVENSGHEKGLKPEWADNISKRLRELEAYKNPEIVISLRD